MFPFFYSPLIAMNFAVSYASIEQQRLEREAWEDRALTQMDRNRREFEIQRLERQWRLE